MSAESMDLRERAAALKHDLGKYVAWRSANLPDAAWEGPLEAELTDALRADLLSTRTRRDGTGETAWGVFDRLTEGLAQPWPDELVEVRDAVARLRGLESALSAPDTSSLAEARNVIREAQAQIRAQLRDLARRLAQEGN